MEAFIGLVIGKDGFDIAFFTGRVERPGFVFGNKAAGTHVLVKSALILAARIFAVFCSQLGKSVLALPIFLIFFKNLVDFLLSLSFCFFKVFALVEHEQDVAGGKIRLFRTLTLYKIDQHDLLIDVNDLNITLFAGGIQQPAAESGRQAFDRNIFDQSSVMLFQAFLFFFICKFQNFALEVVFALDFVFDFVGSFERGIVACFGLFSGFFCCSLLFFFAQRRGCFAGATLR